MQVSLRYGEKREQSVGTMKDRRTLLIAIPLGISPSSQPKPKHGRHFGFDTAISYRPIPEHRPSHVTLTLVFTTCSFSVLTLSMTVVTVASTRNTDTRSGIHH